MSRSSSLRFSRREAFGLLGAGAAAAIFPRSASAAPAFPKGAIIRTVLKDYAPEDLAGGATLFHEHMSFAPDFMTRWTAYARAAREANGEAPTGGGGGGRGAAPAPAPTGPYFMRDEDLMVGEMKQAKTDGIACIVDGGHADMGRD